MPDVPPSLGRRQSTDETRATAVDSVQSVAPVSRLEISLPIPMHIAV
ncbi:MAG: hypothetical protein QOF01_588, partial [Thermomicrobiales bacterium]|nr:hypothetical protein [Thermomicrobiales bacterium]